MLNKIKLEKLKKEIFILKNIDAHSTSTVAEKEIATKAFLSKYSEYTMYEVCKAINLNKGTYYNFIHHKVEKKQNQIKDKILSKEIKEIYNQTKGMIGKQKNSNIITKSRLQNVKDKSIKIDE